MSGNKKSMNALFGKSRVKQAAPDSRWALPSELIGIEIEVEEFEHDVDDAARDLRPEWVMHSDGSLRNGVEWVLAGPLSGGELHTAIDKFFDKRYSYSMSERTSIHLHVNASDDLSVDQFRNIFSIMYCIEPAVFRWADENRKWCGYCQPLTDFTPSRLAQILADNDSEASFVKAVRGAANQDRYYGLNVAAFHKHGTLEFRYFPCTKDKLVLINWIQFVMEVKRAALMYESPAQLFSTLDTKEKIEAFISRSFPSCAERLLSTLDILETLKRVEHLSAFAETDVTSVKGTDRHRAGTAETKGWTRLIQKKFAGKTAKAEEAFDVFKTIGKSGKSSLGIQAFLEQQRMLAEQQAQARTSAPVAPRPTRRGSVPSGPTAAGTPIHGPERVRAWDPSRGVYYVDEQVPVSATADLQRRAAELETLRQHRILTEQRQRLRRLAERASSDNPDNW